MNSLPAESMNWLLGRIDYERAITMPYRHDDFRLDRMRSLLQKLGSPDRRYAIVHIAGTKGKGSTAAMVSSILSAAGLGTGLFSSPHLERIEERIRWNGQPIDADEFAALIEQVRPAVLEMDTICQRDGYGGPTFFEITTAMALVCFAARGATVVVLEVGLGGRLDSTNVVTPVISAITSISFDHTRQLGRTLAAIAGEKCGIIKPGIPVVSGVTDFEARAVVRQVANQRGCVLRELSRDFEVAYESPTAGSLSQIAYRSLALSPENLAATPSVPHRARLGVREKVSETADSVQTFAHTPTLSRKSSNEVVSQLSGEGVHTPRRFQLGLVGRHQAANAALAITIADELRRQGFAIPEAAYAAGLASVQWPARIEVLRQSPTVILDAAHNVASLAALLETLRECYPARRRWLIFATSRDKPAEPMLRQLRTAFDEIILTKYQHNPRAVPIAELMELLSSNAYRRWHRPKLNVGPAPAGQRINAATKIDSSQPNSEAVQDAVQERDRCTLRQGPRLHQIATPAEAWNFVRERAQPEDLVCITGSFFLAAELRPLLVGPAVPGNR
jgi:dihydrofolate synthase / folylpolyglutamate synthase